MAEDTTKKPFTIRLHGAVVGVKPVIREAGRRIIIGLDVSHYGVDLNTLERFLDVDGIDITLTDNQLLIWGGVLQQEDVEPDPQESGAFVAESGLPAKKAAPEPGPDGEIPMTEAEIAAAQAAIRHMAGKVGA